MAQQLSELKQKMSEMTTDELQAHIKQIRNKKYKEKPATKKRANDAAKQKGKAVVSKIQKLANSMSQADIDDLLKSIK